MTGVAFSGDPVTPTRCSTSTTYPAIGMRTQVGRRSWARDPLFAIRLRFSCTASRRGRWGDARQCTTPLVLRPGARLGAESQAAGRKPPAGTDRGGGCAFFLGVQEPRGTRRRSTKPPTLTTATSGRLPPLRTLRCAPSNPLAARTWGWCQHVWSLGAGRGMTIATSSSDGCGESLLTPIQVLDFVPAPRIPACLIV